MSKAKSPKDILSRMKAVTTRERKPARGSAPPVPEGHTAAPGAAKKKVRITVDLDVETHRFLKVYAAERDLKISDVIRGLIATLGTDEENVRKT